MTQPYAPRGKRTPFHLLYLCHRVYGRWVHMCRNASQRLPIPPKLSGLEIHGNFLSVAFFCNQGFKEKDVHSYKGSCSFITPYSIYGASPPDRWRFERSWSTPTARPPRVQAARIQPPPAGSRRLSSDAL